MSNDQSNVNPFHLKNHSVSHKLKLCLISPKIVEKCKINYNIQLKENEFICEACRQKVYKLTSENKIKYSNIKSTVEPETVLEPEMSTPETSPIEEFMLQNMFEGINSVLSSFAVSPIKRKRLSET